MNKDNAAKYLPLVQAMAEGKTIQVNFGTKTNPEWCSETELSLDDDPECYRIKPEPKLRPWRPEEVPVGCLVRLLSRDSEHNRYILVSINGSHMSFGMAGYQSLVDAFNSFEHSTDGGKTWLPCGVME